jgi:serine/threonine-protein kinase
MPLAVGDKFDRYVIESVLGQGGMGAVFAAYDTNLRRRVALKVVRTDLSDESSAAERLVREARAVAALAHPNIVSVFDAGEVDGVPFIAMELVVGRTLAGFMGGDVPVANKLRWLADIARALDAAHKRGLVHRDIKPSNVLVRTDGVVKVVDFGVACRTRSADGPPPSGDWATLTQEGALVGTPQYMAPEQYRGEAADGASDQFAWGVLAYQLLTGTYPWKERGGTDLVAAILLQTPRALDGQVSGLPSDVAAVVMRAIDKEPASRFATMGDVVVSLEPHLTPTSGVLPETVARPSTRTMRGAGEVRPRAEGTVTRASLITQPRAAARAGLGARAALLGGVAMVALGALTLAGPWTRQAAGPPASASASASAEPPKAPTPVPITELPLPQVGKPEAIAEYRAGIQAYRDGQFAMSRAHFQRAVAIDPSLAAAELRLSAASMYDATPSIARDEYNRAAGSRASLSEHDQEFLHALEPFVHSEPTDLVEGARRVLAAVKHFPGDAEFALYEARMLAGRGQRDAFDRVLALDPKFGMAYAYKEEALYYAGDIEGGDRVAADCLRQVPSALQCVNVKSRVDMELGRCAELTADGKELVLNEPSVAEGYYRLAAGGYATGQPIEAIRQSVALGWSRLPDAEAPMDRARDRFRLHVLVGEFAAAEEDAKDMERVAESDSNRRTHALVARMRVELYEEMGRPDAAVLVAEDFLRKKDAWSPDPVREDSAIANDPTPAMLAALVRARRIPRQKLEVGRKAWLEGWRREALPMFVPYLWLHAYAAEAWTKEEADEALSALADFPPLPRIAFETLADADVGRVYWLAGRRSEALQHLQRAVSSCLAFKLPFKHTRAALTLGDVWKAKGEKTQACSAYRVVLDRWGHARPHSVTADEARTRATALGCPP